MPPDEVNARLSARLAPIRARHPAARWIAPEDLHVTLLFLGAVSPKAVAGIVAQIEGVAQSHHPFRLELTSGSGRTRAHGDGVAWLSAGHGAEDAAVLAVDLRSALAPDPNARSVVPVRQSADMRPHMTVARRASSALIADLASVSADLPIGWSPDRATLFRSHLEPGGSRYEVLHEAMLGEGSH